jgi:hypothetical protein
MMRARFMVGLGQQQAAAATTTPASQPGGMPSWLPAIPSLVPQPPVNQPAALTIGAGIQPPTLIAAGALIISVLGYLSLRGDVRSIGDQSDELRSEVATIRRDVEGMADRLDSGYAEGDSDGNADDVDDDDDDDEALSVAAEGGGCHACSVGV